MILAWNPFGKHYIQSDPIRTPPIACMDVKNHPGNGLSLSQLVFALNQELERASRSPLCVARDGNFSPFVAPLRARSNREVTRLPTTVGNITCREPIRLMSPNTGDFEPRRQVKDSRSDLGGRFRSDRYQKGSSPESLQLEKSKSLCIFKDVNPTPAGDDTVVLFCASVMRPPLFPLGWGNLP